MEVTFYALLSSKAIFWARTYSHNGPGVSEAIKGWGRGGGGNGAAKLGGGEQIGAKSWIFQTELGPIPVTRCDQNAFSHQV